MHTPNKPNHLAQVIDYQKSAATTLPKSLMEKCVKLAELTQEIKQLIDKGLPEEILKTLWVVYYDTQTLTLSVHSQTAANHLRYQANNLTRILKEQSITFHQLKNIDVIVTYPASIDHLNSTNRTSVQHNKQSNLIGIGGTNRDIYGLTESTKRTIAHTTEHVITDERLKKALQSLLKP